MQRYLEELTQLNKMDWHKYFLLLIKDPEPRSYDTSPDQKKSARHPRAVSHYNLYTISRAMDLSA